MTTLEVLDQTQISDAERQMAAFLLDPMLVIDTMPKALETPQQKVDRLWPSRPTTPHGRELLRLYKSAETAVVMSTATPDQIALYGATQGHLHTSNGAYDRSSHSIDLR